MHIGTTAGSTSSDGSMRQAHSASYDVVLDWLGEVFNGRAEAGFLQHAGWHARLGGEGGGLEAGWGSAGWTGLCVCRPWASPVEGSGSRRDTSRETWRETWAGNVAGNVGGKLKVTGMPRPSADSGTPGRGRETSRTHPQNPPGTNRRTNTEIVVSSLLLFPKIQLPD